MKRLPINPLNFFCALSPLFWRNCSILIHQSKSFHSVIVSYMCSGLPITCEITHILYVKTKASVANYNSNCSWLRYQRYIFLGLCYYFYKTGIQEINQFHCLPNFPQRGPNQNIYHSDFPLYGMREMSLFPRECVHFYKTT